MSSWQWASISAGVRGLASYPSRTIDSGLHEVSVKAASELRLAHSEALGRASVPAADASRSWDSSSLLESV